LVGYDFPSADHQKEAHMANPTKRVVADCRQLPSDKPCTVTIAGTEDEVLDLAVHHATVRHGHKNSPELRAQIRTMLKEERKVG
jgi:hypothetical protein